MIFNEFGIVFDILDHVFDCIDSFLLEFDHPFVLTDPLHLDTFALSVFQL